MKFRDLIENESNGKFKAGEQPKFSNNKKQKISDYINSFIKKNSKYLRDIHFPSAIEKKGTYHNDNLFVLAVTSEECVTELYTWFRMSNLFSVSDMGKNIEFDVDKLFRIRLSSGKGFYYNGEGKQKSPKTDQQEKGTIEFLKYYLDNNVYPSNEIINKIIGFDFDKTWYNSFVYQADAIIEFTKLNSSFKIDLDSAEGKIGKKIFKLLKKLPETDGIEKDNWNPADIWVYKNESTVLSKLSTVDTLIDFNSIIKELFITKDLIGISLKKQSNKKSASVIEMSKEKPFDLGFGKSSINAGVNHCDIITKGYPKGFFIRSRAKAKTITSDKDIKIYFEGKTEGSKVFLGAIDKKMVNSMTGYDGVPPKEITYKMVEDLFNKLSLRGNVINTKTLKEAETASDMRLKYLYVLYTYVDKIQSLPSQNLNRIAMAGYKMNDYSSIHLKVGA